MALNAPGPVAAAKMRDAGAEVTKVEPPGGDPLEDHCPGWYRELHAGIAVVRIDLKSPHGVQTMHDLLARADLFLASQRPSALSRLGLDADTLLAGDSPVRHLRWLNIVGERASPETPGHDLTYLAQAGLLAGEMPRTLVADLVGAEHAFAAGLLLLRQPPGSRAVVGLYDALAPLLAPLLHGVTAVGGILGGGLPAYGLYDTRSGRIAVAALEPRFRRRLYEELQLPLDADLTETFGTREAGEWEAWARARDLPIVSVR
jgi:crotonobetainyl-CoA:carnitine CoA-transferase CaiB-like acyl-CoA transferase